MMRLLRSLVEFCAATWLRILLLLMANLAALTILFSLENRFVDLTGRPVFDTQNDLTASLMREQLPLYQGAARDAYFIFASFDFLFPFVGALTIAVLLSRLLGHSRTPFTNRLLSWKVQLLPFSSTLFDWLENVMLLAAVSVGTSVPQSLLSAAIVFKRLKLTTLNISVAVLVVVLLLTVVNRLRKSRAAATLS